MPNDSVNEYFFDVEFPFRKSAKCDYKLDALQKKWYIIQNKGRKDWTTLKNKKKKGKKHRKDRQAQQSLQLWENHSVKTKEQQKPKKKKKITESFSGMESTCFSF